MLFLDTDGRGKQKPPPSHWTVRTQQTYKVKNTKTNTCWISSKFWKNGNYSFKTSLWLSIHAWWIAYHQLQKNPSNTELPKLKSDDLGEMNQGVVNTKIAKIKKMILFHLSKFVCVFFFANGSKIYFVKLKRSEISILKRTVEVWATGPSPKKKSKIAFKALVFFFTRKI